MSKNVSSVQSQQAYLSLPHSTGTDAMWLRALVVFQGEVPAFGGCVKGDDRIATADVPTVPGTTAWSPPI
jgi:hypothetical protein